MKKIEAKEMKEINDTLLKVLYDYRDVLNVQPLPYTMNDYINMLTLHNNKILPISFTLNKVYDLELLSKYSNNIITVFQDIKNTNGAFLTIGILFDNNLFGILNLMASKVNNKVTPILSVTLLTYSGIGAVLDWLNENDEWEDLSFYKEEKPGFGFSVYSGE